MPLNLPLAPIITSVTNTGFVISVSPDGNPAGTFYAYQVLSNSILMYVDGTGNLQPIPVYLNVTTVTVKNTTPGQLYTVSLAAALDGFGTGTTNFGPVVTVQTLNNTVVSANTAFTPRQEFVIMKSRVLMPENFSANVTDEKILAYAEVILSDINLFPPLGNLTIDTIPDNLLPTLFFGISLFSELFFQMRATLEDFDYNDNGLTVRVDQVGKIDQSYRNMVEVYRNMISNYKKTQIMAVGGKGLGTPRFQSQVGQFLKIALGSAFTWNTP